jgi:hypothetical protein
MHHSFKDQFVGEIKLLLYSSPKFVYSGSDLKNLNGIPVFLYHTIDPKIFESHLLFLKKNEYRTLTIEEFYEILLNKRKVNYQKTVLLTIDDARSSVWRYAYPLLKKYQMHATVFVIPGFIEESNSCQKNLEDFWEGKCSLNEIFVSDSKDSQLCKWAEIIQMYNSGLINIESHTLFHREIFINNKIVNFISNDTRFTAYDFPGTPYLTSKNIGEKISPKEYLGLPLFESAPLMLAGPKLGISDEFIIKCKKIYQDFTLNDTAKKDWRIEIKNIVEASSNKREYFVIQCDSIDDVKEDLIKAREIIQSKLGDNAGNHLCLPWTIGNDLTIKISKELGIKSCFWGTIRKNKISTAGSNTYYIPRLKNDFLPRLPGANRKSLISIYSYKIRRRLAGEKPF